MKKLFSITDLDKIKKKNSSDEMYRLVWIHDFKYTKHLLQSMVNISWSQIHVGILFVQYSCSKDNTGTAHLCTSYMFTCREGLFLTMF